MGNPPCLLAARAPLPSPDFESRSDFNHFMVPLDAITIHNSYQRTEAYPPQVSHAVKTYLGPESKSKQIRSTDMRLVEASAFTNKGVTRPTPP